MLFSNIKFSERSDNVLEYDEYRLRLQGMEKSITDLRDSL